MAEPKKRPAAGQLVLPLSRSQRFDVLLASVKAAGIDMARSLAREAAEGLWTTLAKKFLSDIAPPACSVALTDLPAEAAGQARALGSDLAALPLAQALYEIGQLYTHALPAEHRSENGIFYTPPALVAHLLDRATEAGMDWQREKIISPSCGGGAFLIEDARRMVAAMGQADPAIIVASVGSRLRGWDRDPFACWLSQLAVEAALLPQVVASGKRLAWVTECRDSLMADLGAHAGGYGLVNDNPAFGKVKKSEILTAKFDRSQRGHINTYGLFMDLAIHLARPRGGIIAYLTPTSYLGGDYFAKLRALLAKLAPPVSIDLVESRHDVFADVLQEVALSCFVRGQARRPVACAAVHAEPSGLRIDNIGELVLPQSADAPWIIARNIDAVPIVAAMQSMTARLKNWGYRVKTGPLVPHKNKDRMHGEKADGFVPVIWAESISATGGRFSVTCKRAGRMAWYQPRPRNDPNISSEPALLLQRTTAKEQARRLIGAVMSAAAIKAAGGRVAVENHVNMVIPIGAKPVVPLSKLAAFFASKAADRAFRCLSGSVAVSATEIEALPLPSADDLLKALSAADSEVALCRLYGMADGQAGEEADTRAPGG